MNKTFIPPQVAPQKSFGFKPLTRTRLLTGFISMMLLMLIVGLREESVFAQASSSASPSVLYVPLIGITSVPDPLALPNGAASVTYYYAVKNFLAELPLTNIQVIDDKCSPVKFVSGDENHDSKLDYNETWRYTCTIILSVTTQSIATAAGQANSITATHKAYTTVIVGSNNPPPLVSIVNVTKVVYPLSLPAGGGNITFTYKVTNPGTVPLSDVKVTDDKCTAISGKLGDTNGNNLLDINEVWIYTCTMTLTQTTTNTVTVEAFANGLKAVSDDTITIKVDTPFVSSPPLFDVGISPVVQTTSDLKIVIWGTLSGALIALIVFFAVTRKAMLSKLIRNLDPHESDEKL